MPQFNVDEDLAALVEKLAKPKPFENLTFNNALRRVLTDLCSIPKNTDFEDLDQMLARAMENKKNTPKKAPSPSAQQWVALVPELKKQLIVIPTTSLFAEAIRCINNEESVSRLITP